MPFALAMAFTSNPAHAGEQTPVDLSHVVAHDPGSSLAPGWQHGAFMEVFVRGYQDSNGDGIGDLKGLTQRLDYLQALGIRGLWLMPITRSQDHDHGYAVTDYRNIEPDYGTLADLDELVRQAHRRGIGVIIDYVINHSAASHPLFQQAKSSHGNAYRNWYVWQDVKPEGWDIWGKDPWYPSPTGYYFATFGPHAPDFNLRNPATVDYHLDTLRFWLNRGLDGFRFDAVPHLIENNAKDWNDQPESYALMGRIHTLVNGYQNRHIVCEATASPTAWAAPGACGSAFAFGLERHIAAAAKGHPDDIAAVAHWFTQAPLTMATMASNHDIFAGERLWDQVHGDLAQYKLAAATYLLLPGTPFIYYGEEVGMAGVASLEGDPKLRTPMSWGPDERSAGFTKGKPFRPVAPNVKSFNAQGEADDPQSLLAFYKTILSLRNSLPAIAQGSYEKPFAQGVLMGYQRKFSGQHVVVLFNYGSTPASAAVDGLPAGAALRAAYPSDGAGAQVDAQGRATIALPPQSVRVYLVNT
jgi:glycosidase